MTLTTLALRYYHDLTTKPRLYWVDPLTGLYLEVDVVYGTILGPIGAPSRMIYVTFVMV